MKIKFTIKIVALLVFNFGVAQLPMSELQNAIKLNSYADNETFLGHVTMLEKRFPNCARIAFLKGTYQYRIGKLNEALDLFTKSIMIDSTFTDSYIAKANIYAQHNKFDDCVFNLTKAIKYDENNLNAYRLRANYYLSANKKQLALNDIEHCIRLTPKEFNLHLEAIMLATNLKDFTKVVGYFAKAYTTPSLDTFMIDLIYAKFLMAQQRFDDAIVTYKKGLNNVKNIYTAEDYNNVSVAFLKTNDYKNALLYSKKSVALNATNLDFLYNLITIYGESKDIKNMKNIAIQIKKIDADNTKIDDITAYYENKKNEEIPKLMLTK